MLVQSDNNDKIALNRICPRSKKSLRSKANSPSMFESGIKGCIQSELIFRQEKSQEDLE